jgi:hypothetical protein
MTEAGRWRDRRANHITRALFCMLRVNMNVRPLHDRIVVRRLEEGEQNIG